MKGYIYLLLYLACITISYLAFISTPYDDVSHDVEFAIQNVYVMFNLLIGFFLLKAYLGNNRK